MLRGALASKLNLADLTHTSPRPAARRTWQLYGIRRGWFFILATALPFSPVFGEDAFEKLGAGFVGAAFLAGEFGFGGDELSIAGGFEDSGAVAFEVGLHAPQAHDSRF